MGLPKLLRSLLLFIAQGALGLAQMGAFNADDIAASDFNCGARCVADLVRHVGFTQGLNPWFQAHNHLWTETIWEEKLGRSVTEFLQALGQDPTSLLSAKAAFCQGYAEYDRCAHKACAEEGHEGEDQRSHADEPLLPHLFGHICRDWHLVIDKYGDCYLKALGSSAGKLCLTTCRSQLHKLNAYTFSELMSSSWGFYALNGRSILDGVCSSAMCLSDCLSPVIAKECPRLSALGQVSQKHMPDRKGKTKARDAVFLRRALRDVFASVKEAMTAHISRIGTYVFWPGVCDSLIERGHEAAEEEKKTEL